MTSYGTDQREQNESLFVFVLWEHARRAEARILDDLRQTLEVVAIAEVAWSEEQFDENLTRFYGTLLPPGSDKQRHCGSGPFLVVVARDPSPSYEYRPTSKGARRVNKNVFDRKQRYRSWTGGGHRVHASNDPTESMHDVHLLLGVDFHADPYAELRTLASGGTLHRELPGARGWDTVADLFSTLNHALRYVVLRNFEGLPSVATLGGHDDIDLLVDSFADATFVLNARPVFPERHRVHMSVTVDDKDLRFDLRHLGDRYYPEAWQRNILESRQRLSSGIYVPDDENHFYTLLYHALVHKEAMAPDYRERFAALGPKVGATPTAEALAGFMLERGYELAPPRDGSVGFHAPGQLVSSVPTAAAGRRRHLLNGAKAMAKQALGRVGLLEPVRRLKRRIIG